MTAFPVLGCGPAFPNTVIEEYEIPALSGHPRNLPYARFDHELDRLGIARPAFPARVSPEPRQQTLEAELEDLRAALVLANLSTNTINQIVTAHAAERAKIAVFTKDWQPPQRTNQSPWFTADHYCLQPMEGEPDRFAAGRPQILPGLPAEFADYFRGSIAWHAGEIPHARNHWDRLLARPDKERPFKSTWAAYMLGKSWAEDNPDRALRFYQTVRNLAQTGFVDSLGLAAASYGWEAQVYYEQSRFVEAMDLYLKQYASGDRSAVASLRWTAARALQAGPAALRPLAKQKAARRVVTAYLLSAFRDDSDVDTDSWVKEKSLNALTWVSGKWTSIPAPANGWQSWHRVRSPVAMWLEAVEAEGVRDMESAEQFALAAYQANDVAAAERWLKRAPVTPVMDWLAAKLFLRQGKVDAAAACLARACRHFPIEPTRTNDFVSTRLAETLFIMDAGRSISFAQQAAGELGALRLARAQFVEALELLLRSGFWLDAAYVAERVLTTAELKNFVDARSDWHNSATNAVELRYDDDSPAANYERLRYLLARRLTREGRGGEARGYYPEKWRPRLDAYAAALAKARSENRPAADRAVAFFEAAKIARHEGMELMGTEVEPDFFVFDGGFALYDMDRGRHDPEQWPKVLATREEVERAKRHVPHPQNRYHYRYTAASLAWEAASLLPNNSDQTALILCHGGLWLQKRDPEAADKFYKTLVRRCRNTPLGCEANRLRWFPSIDEHGRWKPQEIYPVGD